MTLSLYNLFFYLLLPLVLLRLLWRSVREPEYRAQIMQRFGFFRSLHAEGSSQAEGSPQAEGSIWIHAVSAGETIAVAPLVERLVARGHNCIVTNMTPTGRQMCRRLLGHLADRVENCYAPWDLPGAVSRFIRNNKPVALLLVDTELWPNLLHRARRAGVKTLLVNGRLSEKSAAAYRRAGFLARPTLASLDLLAVQTRQHARRFQELGVPASKVHVTGNIKFDAPESNADAKPETTGNLAAGRPVLVGASTHPGEEAALLAALPDLLKLAPSLLLVLAPRHVRRADEVRQLVSGAGFASCSRTEGRPVSADEQVFILDVMGEMQAWLNLAEVAFVGGSLVPVGGHNLLEAVRGRAVVVMGSHLRNIEDIAGQFVEADAMRVVADGQALQRQLTLLLGDNEGRQAMCDRAMEVLEANRGALNRVLDEILEVL